MQDCDGCARIKAALEGGSADLIHEFEHSLLFLGEHQYFEGYCVLMLKDHVRELHAMDEGAYSAVMLELKRASQAVAAAFSPWKLNHASLGNVVQHAHWHILPRYESDPDRFQNPWFRMEAFKAQVPDAARKEELILRIRKELG